MNNIDLKASIKYSEFSTDNYEWIRFTVPTWGDKYYRGASKWEMQFLDEANDFLHRLFTVDGFRSFFLKNKCRVKKEAVNKFLKEAGSSLEFPASMEYSQPFQWWWCQLEGGKEIPGHIMDADGWLYDKLMCPKISVMVDGKEYEPFTDHVSCIERCADAAAFAWELCEASAYNVPYLYAISGSYDHNIEAMYEGGFDIDIDDGLIAVLKYFDDEILPTYNIIVDEDTPRVKAGVYPMHIADLSRDSLRKMVRENKKAIKTVLDMVNSKNE